MTVTTMGKVFLGQGNWYYDQYQLVAGEEASVKLSYKSDERKFDKIQDAYSFVAKEFPTPKGRDLPTISAKKVVIDGKGAVGVVSETTLDKEGDSLITRWSSTSQKVYKMMENGLWRAVFASEAEWADSILSSMNYACV